mgnify:CR=1 FL=1
MTANNSERWKKCQEIIKDNLGPDPVPYETWFAPIVEESFINNVLTLRVPTNFYAEVLESRYLDLLRATLFRVYGKGIKLNYSYDIVKDVPESHVVTQVPHKSPAVQEMNPFVQQDRFSSVALDSQLNPIYTFENYCESKSNKLAFTIANAIVRHPEKQTFNPMFIFGPTGVGKTHLIQAIGIGMKEENPDLRVLYLSARTFESQYTTAVRNNKVNDFINFYQSIDMLIMDDVQEFAGKTATQNTFFHIFNHLHQNGKQLILTSDRAPVLLQGMEERLITRFKWGMVAELEKPTVELRKDILRNKIRRDGLQFPPEVINYIAENVSDSVRDLEGIIISIMAHSTIYNREVDLELAQRIVRKVSHTENKPVTVDNIIQAVCSHFGLDINAIHSKSRKRDVVQARQIAMYLAKNYTDFSTAKIGSLIGGKDHATVLHACKTITELKEVNKPFAAELDEIQATLKQ